MSAEVVSAGALPDFGHEREAAMLRTLGSILRRGSFGTEEVEKLAAFASDRSLEPAARRFARQSISWLAQQSALRAAPLVWQSSADVQH